MAGLMKSDFFKNASDPETKNWKLNIAFGSLVVATWGAVIACAIFVNKNKDTPTDKPTAIKSPEQKDTPEIKSENTEKLELDR